MKTVADLLLARADDDRPALLFEDQVYSWGQVVAESRRRAAFALDRRRGTPVEDPVLVAAPDARETRMPVIGNLLRSEDRNRIGPD